MGKDPDAGKDWRHEEKGMTEDEMVGWHHQLDGYEFEQAPGVGDGQGGLACCSTWGSKESDMTEWLDSTDWIGTKKDITKYLTEVRKIENTINNFMLINLKTQMKWKKLQKKKKVFEVDKKKKRVRNPE